MPCPSKRFAEASELATAPRILVLDPGQFVDEKVGGGAGAHADDTIERHIFNRGPGDCAFQLILICHFTCSLSILFILTCDYCRN